jgi:hypothetical protein
MRELMVANALRRLIALEGEYQKLVKDARDQLWTLRMQQPATAVVVSLVDVDRALRLYEEGHLSGEQLQEWADILEMNDHVEYERDAEEAVANLLFSLSSPEINEPITRAVVQRMRASLRNPREGG